MVDQHDSHPRRKRVASRADSAPRGPSCLSASDIHDALTDVCAETYMLEAERLRVVDLRADGRRSGADEIPGVDALADRRRSVEGRLAELEARAAFLRAELARVSQPCPD
jgi:hypothetical protein